MVLISLNAVLQQYDPDLILTHWGDTWLLPWLLNLSEKYHIAFNPNRDPKCEVLQRKEKSFFTYGQIVYRGRQVQLFGRWHVDACNAMMFGDYGLEGVLEQARVTGLPIQTMARNSPGSGITAMQIIMALQKGILVPYQKQQAESFKSAAELINADQGGLVYQPTIGLHRDVGAIDFFSMYPQIMEHFNLSPETVGVIDGDVVTIPALGIAVDQSKRGFVPETLAPLLKKRYMFKEWLLKLDARDCRYKAYKARVTALKWLLVVCFGYLGFKNARFGRIESHQAVTAYGREVLLRAKEAAEDMGFTVLHLYVDSLFVRKPGVTKVEDYRPLLDEIVKRTGIPISLDGIYRWVAFLPSRLDERIPVANRYFGVFQDGSTKVRGIEMRRGDTCQFVADTQESLLGVLSEALTVDELPLKLGAVAAALRRAWRRLHSGEIPLEQLLVAQKVSRALEEYRTLSPAARAAAQLERIGKSTRPGQHVRFLYMLGEPGVWAWDLPTIPDRRALDISRYEILLIRAVSGILQPIGITEKNIKEWISTCAGYSCAPWRIPASKALPLFLPSVEQVECP
jgi:DNA polymerase-2